MPARNRISKGGSRLTLIRAAAQERHQDARVLADSDRWHGAIYLAGYSVECLLKYAAGQRAGEMYLDREYEIHHLDRLMTASGLLPDLQKQRGLKDVWSAFAQEWNPSLRYRCNMYRERDGRLFFDQINELFQWLWQRSR